MKVCFKGTEVMDLIQGRQTPAIKAKLAQIEASNTAARLHLYTQMEKNPDNTPIPDLTPGYIDYEALD